jgi:hypothetical protein
MPTLEATATVDIADQIEADLQQGREEGRHEGRNETSDSPEGQKEPSSTRNFKCIGLIILFLLIAGGVTAWQLLKSSRNDEATAVARRAAPTDDDCLVVSEGMEVNGQAETMPATVGVKSIWQWLLALILTFFNESWKPRCREMSSHSLLDATLAVLCPSRTTSFSSRTLY